MGSDTHCLNPINKRVSSVSVKFTEAMAEAILVVTHLSLVIIDVSFHEVA